MELLLFECTREKEITDVWNHFCNELMHTNRFFTNLKSENSQTSICFSLILSAIDYMVSNCEYYVDESNTLYRARLFDYRGEYCKNEDDSISKTIDRIIDYFMKACKKDKECKENIEYYEQIIEEMKEGKKIAHLADINYKYIKRVNRIEGFHPNDMKAPPYNKAKQGRINPEGISYLYTCDCPNTCIAEIKPYINSYVSIINIKPKECLKIFSVDSKDYKAVGLENNIFIDFLKDKFMEPYRPEDNLEYLPTQFIAEYIKNKECNGIKHPSSVSDDGNNIIIFDENKVEFAKNTDVYHINKITYEKTKVEPHIFINKDI
ncbi:RES domain-containing protein [Clostridium botulinum]|uniref:RES domain-containing protein n=1 Tax=Clostridium botulinum TaxID=1491 RepID=UPI0017490CA0|nr:RES domain-containing protein [Clostridium botulinum]MBD5642758.1 RES domain-containing protein [Clostridium botulinum]